MIRRYAFELECILHQEKALSALERFTSERALKLRAPGGYRSYHFPSDWVVGFDPSLKPDADLICRTEIASPPLPFEHACDLACAASLLAGEGATIGPHCGLHIHVDARRLCPAQLIACCRQAEQWRPLVSPKRARFCKPVPDTVLALKDPNMQTLRQAWFAGYREGTPERGRGRLHPARRRIVNLGSVWFRGTLEFRPFPAALNPSEIRSALAQVRDLVESL